MLFLAVLLLIYKRTFDCRPLEYNAGMGWTLFDKTVSTKLLSSVGVGDLKAKSWMWRKHVEHDSMTKTNKRTTIKNDTLL